MGDLRQLRATDVSRLPRYGRALVVLRVRGRHGEVDVPRAARHLRSPAQNVAKPKLARSDVRSRCHDIGS